MGGRNSVASNHVGDGAGHPAEAGDDGAGGETEALDGALETSMTFVVQNRRTRLRAVDLLSPGPGQTEWR